MGKVLLLCPPNSKICMRDYFCSKISKGGYYYHPIDFVVLSGIIAAEHDVSVLDVIAEQKTSHEALEIIRSMQPDFILFLTGAASFHEDELFLKKVEEATKARMIALGDILLETPERVFDRWPWLDAALLDFASADVLGLLRDQTKADRNVIVRRTDNSLDVKRVQQGGKEWELPIPRHELFLSQRYSFPFVRNKKFATVLTNLGCPYKCAYCPVSRFSYRERSLEGIEQELRYLAQLHVQEIVFKDQTFGPSRERITGICRLIRKEIGEKAGWVCFFRPELAEKALLQMMAKSGCHTIMWGVESGDVDIRKKYGRSYEDDFLKEIMTMCRQLGVKTVATFMLGLPGETMESLNKTIKLAKTIGCDYASFNVYCPAYGTELRKELIHRRMIEDNLEFMDSGISRPVFSTNILTGENVWKMRQRAVVEFYVRPEFLLKQVTNIRDWGLLVRNAMEGIRVLFPERISGR